MQCVVAIRLWWRSKKGYVTVGYVLCIAGTGVSTSVLVSHVDSVSLVQLSLYLGSMIASARLPPQPIEMSSAAGVSVHWHNTTKKNLPLAKKGQSIPHTKKISFSAVFWGDAVPKRAAALRAPSGCQALIIAASLRHRRRGPSKPGVPGWSLEQKGWVPLI